VFLVKGKQRWQCGRRLLRPAIKHATISRIEPKPTSSSIFRTFLGFSTILIVPGPNYGHPEALNAVWSQSQLIILPVVDLGLDLRSVRSAWSPAACREVCA
jgi:hypothetical protein